MTAVILPWTPARRGWPGNYVDAIQQVGEIGMVRLPWPVSGLTDLPARSDAWLLNREDAEQTEGIVGHGITVTEPYEADGIQGVRAYIDVDFDLLLPLGDGVLTDTLTETIPCFEWDTVDARLVPPASEPAIRASWAAHVRPSARSLAATPGTLPANALIRTLVNRYEHDQHAARIAIAHHGSRCRACDLDFEIKYGPHGAGFIDVHHAVPVSQLRWDYELDPVTDLIPLCLNCHYMAHQRGPDPYSVAELRAMISAAGHLAGSIPTKEQLLAQEEAKRLINPEVRG